MLVPASTQPRRHIHDHAGGQIKNDLESDNPRSLSVIIALCSIPLALAALYWRRLPVLSRGYEPGRGLAVATQRFPSGVINDYITWLVTGVVAIGAALALIVR
jgi:hypothetical protein